MEDFEKPKDPTRSPIDGIHHLPDLPHKTFVIIAAAAVVFVVIFAVSALALIKPPAKGSNLAGQTTPTPSPGPQTEKVSEDVRMTPAIAATGLLSANFTLQAPLSWHSQILADPSVLCLTASGQEPCFQFSFTDAIGSPTTLSAKNNITVYDLSAWRSSRAPFAGTTDPAVKLAQINATEAITPTKLLSPTDLPNFFSPFSRGPDMIGISDVQPIQSQDGTLTGYSFIASHTPGLAYVPQTFAVMVGEAKGVTIAVTGTFTLNDAERKVAPTADNSFFKDYVTSYRYPNATTDLNDAALAVMRSLQFSD